MSSLALLVKSVVKLKALTKFWNKTHSRQAIWARLQNRKIKIFINCFCIALWHGMKSR